MNRTAIIRTTMIRTLAAVSALMILAGAALAQTAPSFPYDLPSEWFACKTSSDCVFVGEGAGAFAVNAAHKDDVEAALCKAAGSECGRFISSMAPPRPDDAVCEAGTCTKWRPDAVQQRKLQ